MLRGINKAMSIMGRCTTKWSASTRRKLKDQLLVQLGCLAGDFKRRHRSTPNAFKCERVICTSCPFERYWPDKRPWWHSLSSPLYNAHLLLGALYPDLPIGFLVKTFLLYISLCFLLVLYSRALFALHFAPARCTLIMELAVFVRTKLIACSVHVCLWSKQIWFKRGTSTDLPPLWTPEFIA